MTFFCFNSFGFMASYTVVVHTHIYNEYVNDIIGAITLWLKTVYTGMHHGWSSSGSSIWTLVQCLYHNVLTTYVLLLVQIANNHTMRWQHSIDLIVYTIQFPNFLYQVTNSVHYPTFIVISEYSSRFPVRAAVILEVTKRTFLPFGSINFWKWYLY